jgi:predicted Zn-dependent protease
MRLQRILAAIAVAGLLPAPASAQFRGLGSMVRKAQTVQRAGNALRDIGEAEEIQLGSDLSGIILGAAPLVQDQAKQHYVNRLGRWLASHSERANLPWKFGIVESSDLNAWSMPGGYVLVTRGMFDNARSESELAGVLAHEIAHVVKKHQLNALQKKMGNGALRDISGLYGGGRLGGGGIVGRLTGKLLQSGRELFALGLDKADEYEADQMGVVIAARSGYSPYGLVGVLQTLAAETPDGRYGLMSRTHPQAADRLTRLDGTMGARLDGLTGLVDDLPSFDRLRNPAAAPSPASPSAPAKARPRRRRG